MGASILFRNARCRASVYVKNLFAVDLGAVPHILSASTATLGTGTINVNNHIIAFPKGACKREPVSADEFAGPTVLDGQHNGDVRASCLLRRPGGDPYL